MITLNKEEMSLFDPSTFETTGQKSERFGCVKLFFLVDASNISRS